MSRRTRGVLAAVVLALALGVPASPVHAYPTEILGATPAATYNALTRLAMTATGQQQGECFPWMRRVVQAATGIVIGNDYRLGYLQAGLTEVSPQAARNGDIIQIANDANTRPDADYPGLHTTFILENQGGGLFRVVDSNALYDGVVRVRRDYDPAATAARYPGLSFHIYRLPDRTSGGLTPTPPASLVNTPGIIPIGSAAEIAADGDCLRVRSIAGLSGAVMGCLPTGARVTVTQPGPDVDGYHWVTITNGGITGWASERYLRAVSGTGATTPQTIAAPTPPPTTGRILSGVIPPKGMGLIVFGGGTESQLLAASGCPAETASFWASEGGNFVQLIPGVSVPIVNAAWRSKFPGGIPASIALMASCRPDTGSTSAPISAPAPSSSAPGPAANVAPVPAASPAPLPPPTAASTPLPATASTTSTYIVQAGDSLSSIAERSHGPSIAFNDYLDMLRSANGLAETSTISAGQTLRLPATASTGSIAAPAAPSTYTVQVGDSLWGIAERFHGASISLGDYVGMLRSANGLTETGTINAGQTLRLPGATSTPSPPSTPTTPPPAATPAPAAASSTYTVEAGDSFSRIAERFRGSVPFSTFLDILYLANGMTGGSDLQVGQVLRLPQAAAPSSAAATPAPTSTAPTGALTTSGAPSSYTVVAGDSLSSIAERFRAPGASIGAVLDMLYAANALTAESTLQVGQALRILR